jgi:glycerol-3-phosphate dehydrogenase
MVIVGTTDTDYSGDPGRVRVENEDVEYINTGTWSPAFEDVECTKAFGKKCFAWIRPTADGKRSAHLYEWKEGQSVPISQQNPVVSTKESA